MWRVPGRGRALSALCRADLPLGVAHPDGAQAPETARLYPADLADQIDALAPWLYDRLNNGVYKAGFASTQLAYDEATDGVFDALDRMEAQLGDGRAFLLGSRITESDLRLFVTLIRFDAAYHGLFKTNRRQIADYPHLSGYMARVLDLPGIRDTVSLDHIKKGYYSIKALNPGGIVPSGPAHVTRLITSGTLP